MTRSHGFGSFSIRCARTSAARSLLVSLVLAFSQPAAAQTPELGSIRGLVYDSLFAVRPLGGATIEILELGRLVTTDGRGVFRIDSVPAGQYTISFTHPELDAIGLYPPPRAVTLGAGIDLTVVLSTPAATTIYRGLCGSGQEQNTGVLVGRVTDADASRPVNRAEVRGEWTVTTIAPTGGLVKQNRRVSAVTDPGGRYRLCGVPNDVSVLLTTRTDSVIGSPLELALEGRLVAKRDLFLARADALPTAVLGGVVRGPTGEPVPGALVVVLGVTTGVRTGPDGRFRIDSLPSGSHAVDARAVGYQRGRAAVSLRSGEPAFVELKLERAAEEGQDLPEVVVKADASASDRTGFTARRLRGDGVFIGSDDVRRRGTARVQDLFYAIPGIKVETLGTEYNLVSTRGGAGGFTTACAPMVYLDGVRIPPQDDMTSIPLMPEEIHGIEIYSNPTFAPVEYQRTNNSCAIILAWSKRGRRR